MQSVHFAWRCHKCGLETPCFAEFPDGQERVQAEHECAHCDEPLTAIVTLAEIRSGKPIKSVAAHRLAPGGHDR